MNLRQSTDPHNSEEVIAELTPRFQTRKLARLPLHALNNHSGLRVHPISKPFLEVSSGLPIYRVSLS